ncbi:MAG: AmpG family muropeptide MFS transporter [Gammaproteobacteria bacterium]
MAMIHYTQLFTNRRVLVVLILGFSSGLPLALTAGTLQAWFTVDQADVLTIGFLTLVGQPYVYKFLWAPFLDHYALPFLGRRRGWMLLTQICLFFTILFMAFLKPTLQPMVLGIMALLVSFFSASQDIIVDAYRTEILKEKERGIGSAFFMTGYRIAMLVSGALALVLAEHIGWRDTYLCMGSLMVLGMWATFIAPEPVWKPAVTHQSKSILIFAADAFREFLSRERAIMLLLLVVLYKLGMAFSVALTTHFLIRGLGFSLTEIGTVAKTIGLTATLLGALTGGVLLVKLGLYRSLFLFGILQAIAILLFMLLALVGKNYSVMVITLFVENFFSGMASDVFVVLLMTLCHKEYTATQFALLASLSAIGRVFTGPVAGYMVQYMPWANFYFYCFLIALPGLILLYYLRHHPIFKNSSSRRA